MMGSPENGSKPPYPDLRSAFTLTILAMLAAAFTGVAFIDFGLLAAVGIGQAIGVGAVATMGAQRVPEPQAARLGLRALDWKMVPTILCLAPAVLLVSELDNIAADWSSGTAATEIVAETKDEQIAEAELETDRRIVAAEASAEVGEGEAGEDGAPPIDLGSRLIDPNDPLSLLSAFIVMVGISPVVEEFLFRGVIQQGLVQRMGMLRGVTIVALLWTLLRPAPIAGVGRFLAAAVASFGLGWALGIVRLATRSILGSILLASSWAAIGLGAIALEERVPLPGMNVEGTHLPWSVTLACLGLVGWAGWTIFVEADRQFRADRAGRQQPPA
jgi:hypothetical protein